MTKRLVIVIIIILTMCATMFTMNSVIAIKGVEEIANVRIPVHAKPIIKRWEKSTHYDVDQDSDGVAYSLSGKSACRGNLGGNNNNPNGRYYTKSKGWVKNRAYGGALNTSTGISIGTAESWIQTTSDQSTLPYPPKADVSDIQYGYDLPRKRGKDVVHRDKEGFYFEAITSYKRTAITGRGGFLTEEIDRNLVHERSVYAFIFEAPGADSDARIRELNPMSIGDVNVIYPHDNLKKSLGSASSATNDCLGSNAHTTPTCP